MYVPLNNIILNSLWLFLFFPGMALSIISCISSVDTVAHRMTFLLMKLSFLQNSLCQAMFTAFISIIIRSNAGIMAGNQDPVGQSEI